MCSPPMHRSTVCLKTISKDKICTTQPVASQCSKNRGFATKQEIVVWRRRTSPNLTWILQCWGNQTATGNVRDKAFCTLTFLPAQIWKHWCHVPEAAGLMFRPLPWQHCLLRWNRKFLIKGFPPLQKKKLRVSAAWKHFDNHYLGCCGSLRQWA